MKKVFIFIFSLSNTALSIETTHEKCRRDVFMELISEHNLFSHEENIPFAIEKPIDNAILNDDIASATQELNMLGQLDAMGKIINGILIEECKRYHFFIKKDENIK